MTPIQWALVELPYLSQDFVIVLALVYLIIGQLTVFLVAACHSATGYWVDDPDTWWEGLLAIALRVALWWYLLYILWAFDD